MDLFIQVKNAYDILNDPEKRAIYDVVGLKGIRAEGWEVSEPINHFREEFSLWIVCRLSHERKQHGRFWMNMND